MDDDAELRQLRADYAEALPGKVAAIAADAGALETDPLPGETVAAMARQAHDLAGSAGSYGFPSVSEAARALEISLKTLTGLATPSAGDRTLARTAVETLQEVTTAVSRRRPERPAAVPETGGQGGSRILLIDDDPSILTLLGTLLRRHQYTVLTAPDGEAGLKIANEQIPDLILLDASMPGLDGYAVAHRLQNGRATYHIPVVFVTAHDEEQDKARAFAVGAADYLVKPVTDTSLLQTVRRSLSLNRRWQELQQELTRPVSISTRMSYDFSRFKDFLLTQVDLPAEAMSQLARMTWAELPAVTAKAGLGSVETVALIAQFCGLRPIRTLDKDRIRLGVFPAAFCRANDVVALEGDDGSTDFVVTNPFNLGLIEAIQQILGSRNGAILVTAPETVQPLLAYRPEEVEPSSDFGQLEAQLRATYDPAELGPTVYESGAEKSGPIIQLINKLIETAYQFGASDIHIEPQEHDVVVRYRVDGRLRIANRFQPQRLAHPMVARLKVMAGLDISEKRLPQDGRIAFKDFSRGKADFDLRVATAPMAYGEKVVMRIIDKQKTVRPLHELGFSEANLARYRAGLKAPHGMVLHVGPTGSGKSMTLYAALNEIQTPEINIHTAEDPIEYTLPGLNQLQVKPDIGLTFARALRSFLRLDPDVILVGEIRDRETAGMAVEAAMTGHLLFSTLHTNDAATTVTRFIEMGVEPYLISATLTMICAQRLLRRLCPGCKLPRSLTASERAMVGKADGAFQAGPGCEACQGQGYRGRVGIHEILIPDAELRTLINTPHVTAETIQQLAVAKGMRTLFDDAMAKVGEGLCSLDDVLGHVAVER